MEWYNEILIVFGMLFLVIVLFFSITKLLSFLGSLIDLEKDVDLIDFQISHIHDRLAMLEDKVEIILNRPEKPNKGRK
jgi:hypothetical protein